MNRFVRHLGSFAVLASTACGPSGLPAPTLESVSPGFIAQSDSPEITVVLRGVLPFSVNYDRQTAAVTSELTLEVGDHRYGPMDALGQAHFAVRVPSELPVGTHDLTVYLPDERQATLPDALTVTPGQWPATYSFDPIADQKRNVPFQVVLRAAGGSAASFMGTVKLAGSRRATPANTAPFANGVATFQVTCLDTASAFFLTASDMEGHTARSNDFRVLP